MVIEIEDESFKQTCIKREWMAAMEEMEALVRNQMWKLVPKPKEVKPIACKRVYKIKKRKEYGSMERYPGWWLADSHRNMDLIMRILSAQQQSLPLYVSF